MKIKKRFACTPLMWVPHEAGLRYLNMITSKDSRARKQGWSICSNANAPVSFQRISYLPPNLIAVAPSFSERPFESFASTSGQGVPEPGRQDYVLGLHFPPAIVLPRPGPHSPSSAQTGRPHILPAVAPLTL